FSDDGQQVATTGSDRTARVWSAATGEPLTPPLPLGAPGVMVAFREAGPAKRPGLDTVDETGTLRHWDLPPNEAFETTSPHAGRVSSVSFSPDGRRALTACFEDGTA